MTNGGTCVTELDRIAVVDTVLVLGDISEEYGVTNGGGTLYSDETVVAIVII